MGSMAGKRSVLFAVLLFVLLVGMAACGRQSSITNPVIGQDPTPPNPDPFIYSVTLAADKGEVDSTKADAKDRTITFTAITSFVPSGVLAPGIWVTYTYTFNGTVVATRAVKSDSSAKAIDTYIVTLNTTGTLTAQVCVTNSTGVTNCATVSVRVIKPLKITPTTGEVPCTGSPGTSSTAPLSFIVTGGTPGYCYTLAGPGTVAGIPACTALGGTDPAVVTYTPPGGSCPASDTKVTLTIFDSAGASVAAEITIKAAS
jgi:hypothetical protein